jgi:molecular chaperone DnaK (HSP70)
MFLPENFSYKPTKDSIYFGIDLGTTYTLIATVDSSDVNIENLTQIPVKFISYKQVSPIKHGGEIVDEKVASIIAISDGKPFCGSKLYELKGHEDFVRNQNIFYHWKLDLGIDRHPLYPDAVSKELDTPAKLAGKVLNFCRMGFTKNKETRLYNTVITAPASFQMNQRKDIIEAAKIAKIELSNQMLIDEPNAAFIGYFNSISQAEKEIFLLKGNRAKRVLVFDIGGGTCDLSILEISYSPSKGLLIGNKAISRYNDLGGQDIDMIIAEDLLYPLFLRQFNLKDDMPFNELSEIILPQLATIGELLKIGICNLLGAKYSSTNLSTTNLENTVYTLENRSLSYKGKEYNFPPLNLLASDFEAVILKLFQKKGYALKFQDKFIRSVNVTINEILDKANLNRLEIDIILPVGGSSSNPLLINKLSEVFSNSKFWIPYSPDKLVAEGAAIYSFFYNRFGKSLINPISSETIGIETKGKQFYPLIERGEELPVKISIPNFKMQALLQREIIVPICLNDINHIVQEIKIPLKTIYNGNEKVTINAELDANKVMEVEIFIEDEQIMNYKLENPFFFGSLSKDQVKFVTISEKLDNARRLKDNTAQKHLMVSLLEQYYDINNYHEMSRLAEEYLKKFDSDDDTVLNYSYIGNSNIGRKEAAQKALEKAILLNPEEPAYIYNNSILIEEIENADAALHYLLTLSDSLKKDSSIRCRIVILKNSLGTNSEIEATEITLAYEKAPSSFLKFDVDNLLQEIHYIAKMTFTRKQTAAEKDREKKVLIAAQLPNTID